MELAVKASTVVDDEMFAVGDSEAVEVEESVDELVSGGRGTNTFPKEKEEGAPADENSKLLGEGIVIEVEGECNLAAKTVTQSAIQN